MKSSDLYILSIFFGNIYIFFGVLIPRIYGFITGLLSRNSNLSLSMALLYGIALFLLSFNILNLRNAYEANEVDRKVLIKKAFTYLIFVFFTIFLIEVGNAYGVNSAFPPSSFLK